MPSQSYRELSTIAGAWDLSFPEKSGAPAKVVLDSLSSWTVNPDPGVKYFSGTAVYTKSFDFKKGLSASASRVFLDLGKVSDIAEVILNGTTLDTIWKSPYRLEVTRAIKKGKNLLEIRVTNEWTDRLIGDNEAPADKKVLSSYTRPFGGKYELQESGLLGPVKILTHSIEQKP